MKHSMQKEIILSKQDAQRLREKLLSARSTKESITLLDEIKRAAIIEQQEMPVDVITMNSVVQFLYMNKVHQIQLVYPEEANIKDNKVSILAPIAMALLGYRKGDI